MSLMLGDSGGAQNLLCGSTRALSEMRKAGSRETRKEEVSEM